MVTQDKAITGGEPVFAGTRIPVRLIADMVAEGVPADEILTGYPALDAERVALAPIWTAANPTLGHAEPFNADRLESIHTHRTPMFGVGD